MQFGEQHLRAQCAQVLGTVFALALYSSTLMFKWNATFSFEGVYIHIHVETVAFTALPT